MKNFGTVAIQSSRFSYGMIRLIVSFGAGMSFKGELGDDAECSLRTDHQVQRAVAGTCLETVAPILRSHLSEEQPSSRARNLLCIHILLRACRLHFVETLPPSVANFSPGSGGYKSPCFCASSARGRLTERPALRGQQSFQRSYPRILFILVMSIHDAAINSNRRSGKTGSCSSRDHRDGVLITDFHDRCNVL